ncbi:PepSY domain-containing protein [Novosphingobium sp. KCTC 2891]|uniref:PepSY domain-containing protein n=1 Tax=Novosphingobium sp. KCTC 2891 TaxID=2989730 RepID=UPI0022214A43|nr:PepSY domain-containing protein [Novosphingobium sp. KCTC 2891]MCW1384111.1 PepSY domain-containing protein [Novosphingobium sp. KCTC 2891]
MRWTVKLVGALAALHVAAVPLVAHAEPRADEQGEARRDLRAGNVRSLRDIERRVLPSKPGMQYLGPEYDPAAMAYRLKFIRDGRVVFVDVDARTGQVLGESR